MVADRYQTNHYLDMVESDDFDLIDTLATLYDEPYADSSAIPTYRVCELARKHVTVALSGDGGDESFGGYRRYRLHLMGQKMRSALPLALRRPLFGSLGKIHPKADWAPRGSSRAKTTLEGMARTPVEAYFNSVSIMRAPMRAQLFSQQFKSELGGYDAIQVFDGHAAKANTEDSLAFIQYLDLKTYLVGDINTKVDRASMAHSLEVREPLMDHKLVEWLATLPISKKGSRPRRQIFTQESDGTLFAQRRTLSSKNGFLRPSCTLVPWPARAARPGSHPWPPPGRYRPSSTGRCLQRTWSRPTRRGHAGLQFAAVWTVLDVRRRLSEAGRWTHACSLARFRRFQGMASADGPAI